MKPASTLLSPALYKLPTILEIFGLKKPVPIILKAIPKKKKSLGLIANKTLPIIAQTSYSFPEEVEKIKKLGFNDFISKPLDKERLYELVKKYFNK